jgi:hypothetical protein
VDESAEAEKPALASYESVAETTIIKFVTEAA